MSLTEGTVRVKVVTPSMAVIALRLKVLKDGKGIVKFAKLSDLMKTLYTRMKSNNEKYTLYSKDPQNIDPSDLFTVVIENDQQLIDAIAVTEQKPRLYLRTTGKIDNKEDIKEQVSDKVQPKSEPNIENENQPKDIPDAETQELKLNKLDTTQDANDNGNNKVSPQSQIGDADSEQASSELVKTRPKSISIRRRNNYVAEIKRYKQIIIQYQDSIKKLKADQETVFKTILISKTKLEKERDKYKAKFEESHRINKALKEDNIKLININKEHQEEYSGFSERVKTERLKLDMELKSATKDSIVMKDTLEASKTEITELKSRLQELQSKFDIHVAKSETTIAFLKKDNEKLINENEDLKQQLKQANAKQNEQTSAILRQLTDLTKVVDENTKIAEENSIKLLEGMDDLNITMTNRSLKIPNDNADKLGSTADFIKFIDEDDEELVDDIKDDEMGSSFVQVSFEEFRNSPQEMEKIHKKELDKLESLGYKKRSLNAMLLKFHNNDIESVIQALQSVDSSGESSKNQL